MCVIPDRNSGSTSGKDDTYERNKIYNSAFKGGI